MVHLSLRRPGPMRFDRSALPRPLTERARTWPRSAAGTAFACALLACSDGSGLDFERAASSTLSIAGAGAGNGAVVSSPAGIDCTIAAGAPTGTCAARYRRGAAVTLAATAASGFTFGGWTGACSGTAACRVTLDQARSVTATFGVPTIELTVAGGVGNTGIGSVASDPAGIDCSIVANSASGRCRATFAQFPGVSLRAIPAPGFEFAGWGDGCVGAGTCQLGGPNQTRIVTATFVATARR